MLPSLLLLPARRLVLALAVGACAAGAWAKDKPAVDFDPAMPAATGARELITASDVGPLRELRQVAIAAFNVEFVTSSSSSAQARELGRTGTTGLNVTYRLTGVGPQEMQQATDTLHQAFRKQLQDAGVEVLPIEQVRATAAWRKLAAGGKPTPLERSGKDTRGLVFSADAVPVWGVTAASGGNAFSALAGVGQAMSSIVTQGELITELGVPIVTVDMKVDFAQLQSNTSSFLGRISGTAEVKGKVALTLTSLNVVLSKREGGSNLSLTQPLVLQGDAIDGVKDVTSAAGNVALAVLSLAIGNGGSQTVKEMEAQADPTRFREVVQTNLGAVGGMVAARLGGRL